MQPIANKKGHLENIALPDRSIPRETFRASDKRDSMRSFLRASSSDTKACSFGHCSRVRSYRCARRSGAAQ